MYTTIQTVTGQFSIERLENILMHEHIVLGYAGWFYDPRCAEFDHDAAEKQTLDRLLKLRDRVVNPVSYTHRDVYKRQVSRHYLGNFRLTEWHYFNKDIKLQFL